MTKVNYSRQRTSPASIRQQRWLLVTFAALAGCTLLTVTNRAEQSDSGWAVGTPTISFGPSSANSHQQPILRHVIEQSHEPLLRNPSPSAIERSASDTSTAPRTAAKADAGDGWRAVGQSTLSV